MNTYIVITEDSVKYVYYNKNVFNGEGNVPAESGKRTVLLSEPLMSVFSFENMDKPDYPVIFEFLSKYYNTTTFVYNVFVLNNTVIATVMIDKEGIDVIKKHYNPQFVVPYEFNVAYGIYSRYKRPIVYKGVKRYYYISKDKIIVTLQKSDVPEDALVVNCSEDFPSYDVLVPTYKWKVNKKVKDFPEKDRLLEFVPYPPVLNILKEKIVVSDTAELYRQIIKYSISFVVAILVGVGISVGLAHSNLFVVHYDKIGIHVPKSIAEIKSPTLREFIYQKGYPYTLYELYNNGQEIGYFTNEAKAKWFLGKHPDLQLYKTVYGENGIISKTLINGGNNGGGQNGG